MEAKRAVAVIDIGKTNVKLALIDMNSMTECAVLRQPNPVVAGPPYPHFNVDALWEFITSGLRDFQRSTHIQAITVTTHGASCALLDVHGNLAAPILDYEHDGPDSLAKDYDAVRPDFSQTGSPRLPHGLNLGAQLFWLFRTLPGIRSNTRTVVTYPQYWVGRLTGVFVNEVTSLGCHTDLWNPSESAYSSLVEQQNWQELMALVRQANALIGPVRPDLAARIGLDSGIPVYCGIHDSNASLYPHLLRRDPPFAVVSTGTWVICMAMGADGSVLDPSRDTLINVNGLGQAVPSSRFMGGREFELIMDGNRHVYDAGDIGRVLKEAIMLLPAVEPTSGPFQGREHRWSRDVSALSGGDRFVAVSFYLALMTATCLDLISAAGDIVVEGPFADNALFCDMLAAATARSVIPASGTGTSIGAALLTLRHERPDGVLATPRSASSPDMVAYAQSWKSAVLQFS